MTQQGLLSTDPAERDDAVMSTSTNVRRLIALVIGLASITAGDRSITLDWALMIGVGVWAWIGHEIYGRAHAFGEASVLMPFSYAFILYLTIAGFLVFGTVPDTATLVGAAIIVASGLVIWWRERLKRSPD